MIYHMYCVRDCLTGFMSPTLEQSDPVAMRNFEMAVDSIKRDRSLMAFRPSDYSLYRIADFDSDTGEIVPTFPPVTVCTGDSFLSV